MGLARRGQGARRRPCQVHRRRRGTQRSPATPISPKGGSGTAPVSLSLLLHDVTDIASSSLRELDAVALATNVTVFMKRGTKGQGRLRLQEEESTVAPGVICHISVNTPHDFVAEGDTPLLMFFVTIKVNSAAD